jgi:hypothetical protein
MRSLFAERLILRKKKKKTKRKNWVKKTGKNSDKSDFTHSFVSR